MAQVKQVVEKFEGTYNFPSKLADLLTFWKEILDKVPEQYHTSCVVDQEVSTYYDSGSYECEVYYYREETSLEKEERLNKAELEKQRQIEADLRSLKVIKARLGIED